MTLLERTRPDLALLLPKPERRPLARIVPIDRRPAWVKRMAENAKELASCPDGRFDPGHGRAS